MSHFEKIIGALCGAFVINSLSDSWVTIAFIVYFVYLVYSFRILSCENEINAGKIRNIDWRKRVHRVHTPLLDICIMLDFNSGDLFWKSTHKSTHIGGICHG